MTSGLSCAACGAPLLGAEVCPECGFRPGAAVETDTVANLCPNTVCGVLNPPGVPACQRCGSPMGTALGQVLAGRFRLERRLAVGGFGIVYQAVDLSRANAPVAVKEMIPGSAREAETRRTFFRREADILRSLQRSPIVPRFIDFFETPTSSHLILEFIPGKDLFQILEGNAYRPFPVERVAEWGACIAEVLAMMHAHQPPIIHRDLKPDNIMLLPDGRSIRLIDFGTARELDRAAPEHGPPRTRIFTEGYAPPEQIIGKPEPRSDLFSLAGTLYHLATGKAPEGFFTAREIWSRLGGKGEPIPPDQCWFYELLAINLAEDPKRRYPHASELVRELAQRSVACPACGTPNESVEPYCRRCATPIRSQGPACAQCAKPNVVGSRFCIHCGMASPAERGVGSR